MSAHRWSGWPGAWCLDCGADDQLELCINAHSTILFCVEGHELCTEHPSPLCLEHVNGPCPHPGEGLADPYIGRPCPCQFKCLDPIKMGPPDPDCPGCKGTGRTLHRVKP